MRELYGIYLIEVYTRCNVSPKFYDHVITNSYNSIGENDIEVAESLVPWFQTNTDSPNDSNNR